MVIFDGKIPLLGINSRSRQRSMFIAVYFLKNPHQAGMTQQARYSRVSYDVFTHMLNYAAGKDDGADLTSIIFTG